MGVLDKPSIDIFVEVIEKPFNLLVNENEDGIAAMTDRGLRKRDVFNDFKYKYLAEEEKDISIDILESKIDKDNEYEYNLFISTISRMMNKIGIIIDYNGDDIDSEFLYNLYKLFVIDLEKTLVKIFMGYNITNNVIVMKEPNIYESFKNIVLDVDTDYDTIFEYLETGDVIDPNMDVTTVLDYISDSRLHFDFDDYISYINTYVNHTDSFRDTVLLYIQKIAKEITVE